MNSYTVKFKYSHFSVIDGLRYLLIVSFRLVPPRSAFAKLFQFMECICLKQVSSFMFGDEAGYVS